MNSRFLEGGGPFRTGLTEAATQAGNWWHATSEMARVVDRRQRSTTCMLLVILVCDVLTVCLCYLLSRGGGRDSSM